MSSLRALSPNALQHSKVVSSSTTSAANLDISNASSAQERDRAGPSDLVDVRDSLLASYLVYAVTLLIFVVEVWREISVHVRAAVSMYAHVRYMSSSTRTC